MTEQQVDIESIFESALEIDAPQQRGAYLDEACRGDRALRMRVDALLRANSDAGSFLQSPPAGLTATIAPCSFGTSDEDLGEVRLDFLTPSPKPNCLGTLGQYEVVQVIGRGGMGIVLRAYDTKLNRVVAIKAMTPELATIPMAVKRFLREARAAAAVSHDHVVTIFAIEEGQQPPFIAMEFIDGRSLQQKIDRCGALELNEILRIGMQMARGLSAAHEQGLVHRDIKPANILLENGVDRVKLTDFGLARAVDDVSVTQTGQIAGTPQFMSPEQAQGQPIDARSDLFSLGSVLYTMCTGRPAFRADNSVAVLRRVADDTPRPIREVNSDVPPWLESIILKLLAKDPADRFQSAAEVADLLSQHLAHLQQPTAVPMPQHIVHQTSENDVDTELAAIETAQRMYAVLALVWAASGILFGIIALADPDNDAVAVFSRNALPALVTGGLSLITASIAFLGTWHVTRRDSYRCALAGNIAAMLPVNPMLLLVIPWSIVAFFKIRDPRIREEFRRGRALAGHKPPIDEYDTNTTYAQAAYGACMLAVVMGVLVALAAVVYVVTDKGTLVIETDDPGVRVVILENGETVQIVSTRDDGQARTPVILRSGKYELQPLGDETVVVSRNSVILKRGKKIVVKVKRMDGRPPAAAGAHPVQDNQRTTVEFSAANRCDGHTDRIQRAAFFRDGRRAASASHDTTIRIWDVETGEELQRIETGKPLAGMAISPDDQRIAVGVKDNEDAPIEIWEIRSSKKLAVLTGHTDTVVRLEYSSDGRRLMSCGEDWSVRVWDVERLAMLQRFEISNPNTDAISSDGRLIAGRDRVDDDLVRIWNAASGQSVATFDATKATKVQRCQFSSDASTLVTASFLGVIQFWDIGSGKVVRQFKADQGPIFDIQLTPDGRHLLSSKMHRGIQMWHVPDGRLVAEVDTRPRYFKSLRFSPDGSYVIAADAWTRNAESGKLEVDGAYDLQLYRVPQQFWPQSADSHTNTSPHDRPRPQKETPALDQLVEVAKRDLERVQVLVKTGLAPTTSLMRAEAGLLETQIRRAEVRRNPAIVRLLLISLVELREKELKTTEAFWGSGAVTDAEVQASLKALLEAKVRLNDTQPD